MEINIDSAIFIGFLVATIVVGLHSSKGSNTMRQYAVGDRNFSTATIVATIVATWISGEFFYSSISEAYDKGLYAIWIAIGDPLYLLVIGLFLAPRMGEFLGNLSIAEAMGDLYGQKVRIITAIASFIGTAGLIAIQLKLAGSIFEYAVGIPSFYGIIIATVIVTLYSSLGGIKSVTFTDVIQFFTFGAVIPLSAYAILTSIDNFDIVTNTLTTHPSFDYKEVFNFSNELSLKQLFLFLLFITPGFNPAIFQRVAMAKDTKQVAKSFTIAAVTCLFFAIIINWMSVLTLSVNPSLVVDDVVKYVIFNTSYVGLKGAMLAGIMAMIMSTVDSFVNSTAVIIVHDFCQPLKIQPIKNELLFARVMSAVIGVSSLFLSLREGSLLELLVITESFYMPIVSVPFIMAILGFRSTEKSVILGMVAGFITVLIWDYILQIEMINSVCFGMFANLLVLIGSHYLLKQPGGWVEIKDPAPLLAIRSERRQRFQKFIADIKSFNLLNTFQKNCPQGDGLISIIGFFVMISAFSSTHTLPKEYQAEYSYLLDILYPITLCSSSALISYPLWLQSWKETKWLGICWNIIMFFVLIGFSFLMVLISNFSEIQLMAFLVNIILVSSLITWRWALFTITIGVAITTLCYQRYIHVEIEGNLLTSQFKIVYLLLLVSATVIVFLKPKQEYIEETEHKVEVLEDETVKLSHEVTDLSGKVVTLNTQVGDLNEQVTHYIERIADHEKEMDRLGQTSQRILNNVNHELRLPIGNVINFADMLHETLQKTENNKLLMELAKEVYDNSYRVSGMILNMLDLATLAVQKVNLEKKTVNFSELVEDRVTQCRKIYQKNKPVDFKLDIEPEIMVSLDPNYIRQAVDNLVINAINFSEKGVISIRLQKEDGKVVFTITDQGKGIPRNELYDIFTPFKMGSNSESKACGRGVGLALCKSAIEAHGGSIFADSDGVCGAKLQFTLPFIATS